MRKKCSSYGLKNDKNNIKECKTNKIIKIIKLFYDK